MRYLILGLMTLGAGSFQAQAAWSTPSTSFGMVTVAETMTTLGTLIDQPAPATLNQEDLAAYQQQTEWLKSVLTRLEVAGGVRGPRDAASGQASGRRQYAPIRLTKAIELVRTAVVKESVRFTTLSNVLKTRHESAMNAIRNMK